MPRKTYVADYTDANGKRHRTNHPTRLEATKKETLGRLAAAQKVAAKLEKKILQIESAEAK